MSYNRAARAWTCCDVRVRVIGRTYNYSRGADTYPCDPPVKPAVHVPPVGVNEVPPLDLHWLGGWLVGRLID